MKFSLDHRRNFFCVLTESEIQTRQQTCVLLRQWYPIQRTEEPEVRTLLGRPLTKSDEGIYADEEGNVFQLADKERTEPIEIERAPIECPKRDGAPAKASPDGVLEGMERLERRAGETSREGRKTARKLRLRADSDEAAIRHAHTAREHKTRLKARSVWELISARNLPRYAGISATSRSEATTNGITTAT